MKPRNSPFTPRQIARMTEEMNAMRVHVPETDEHRARKAEAEKKMRRHDERIALKLRMQAPGAGGS